ncbi:dihydrodipicolinate synthetase [Moniliophthora roreri]|nr:dihydrodipicolinate synthetase [Moniliophthora roreri]
MSKPLTPGIFVPLPCFFDDNEDLDLETFKKHVVCWSSPSVNVVSYIGLKSILDTVKAGVKPVVSGSMGEAVHLTHPERAALVRAAREALDSAGLPDVPIIAGAGALSTRETIAFAEEAAEAGADQVIVIPPGYYVEALKEDAYAAVKQYFMDVAAASPVPVLMYNFPAVTGGIDMDSDLICDIAKSAPNVCGIKLTCGAVGKLTRVTALSSSSSFAEQYPRKDQSAPFLVLDGFIDILYPSVAGAASGSITGLANIAPNVCRRLWELCNAEPSKQATKEAQELQALASRADWDTSKVGVAGTKYILNQVFGYNAKPRRPLLPTSEVRGAKLMQESSVKEILALEKKLASP